MQNKSRKPYARFIWCCIYYFTLFSSYVAHLLHSFNLSETGAFQSKMLCSFPTFLLPFLLLKLNQNGVPYLCITHPFGTQSHPTHPIERHQCRFCIQQFQKLRKGKISSISSYCPLQLFSSALGQFHSILHLFETPQNNLSCFLDGEKCQVSTIPLPVDISSIGSFARDLDIEIPAVLTKEMAISVLLTLAFQRSGVLKDLLRVQVGGKEGV